MEMLKIMKKTRNEDKNICPNCRLEMDECTELLAQKVRGVGVLFCCNNCDLLLGRLT